MIRRRFRWFAVALVSAVLTPIASRAADHTLKSQSFHSTALDRKMTYQIALPADYETAKDKRYPVIYLLHGLTGNYLNWARMGAVKAADGFDVILVMPDAGNSWYVNWAESEGGQKNAYEDYMIKDLIGHIDATYRTIARREGRAINGLSMGGYGGLTLGLRHPEMFCSIGSESGALGFARGVGGALRSGKPIPPRRTAPNADRPNPDIATEGYRSPAERTPKGKAFKTAEDADAYDPFKLVLAVPREKLPHITIDCGTDDRLIAVSRELSRLLIDNTIPFNYAESPGAHDGAYWSRAIGPAVALQYTIIKQNLAKNPPPRAPESATPAPAAVEKPKDGPK